MAKKNKKSHQRDNPSGWGAGFSSAAKLAKAIGDPAAIVCCTGLIVSYYLIRDTQADPHVTYAFCLVVILGYMFSRFKAALFQLQIDESNLENVRLRGQLDSLRLLDRKTSKIAAGVQTMVRDGDE